MAVVGVAIAAAAVHPDRPIVAVEGDSGFGFSGMEVETMCRYKLPVKIVVLNNGGIGKGVAEELPDGAPNPPHAVTYGARYDLMMAAFGGFGAFVEEPGELRSALDAALAHDGPALVNVRIHPAAGRKPQKFGWLTT